MAEPPVLQNSAQPHNADDISPYDGAGSSKDVRRADGGHTAVGLPLRQALQPPRPEPKVHDITKKFTEACNALAVGQLVKDEYFTLFESIGALEIMDSKMDSGFLQPGETLEDAYDTLAPLLPEEVIGIMDQLLCYEMAWHTGYPLSQTLLSSVYIDRLLWPEPKVLEEAQFYRGQVPDDKRPGVLLEVLRAYCMAQIKCCDFVIAKITGRDYYEEEDFCTHTYNRMLFVQVPMDVFQRELDAAVEWMEDELSIHESLRTAIIARLAFRKEFLTALDLDCPLERLNSYWPPVLSTLTTINTTQQLGKTVTGSFSTKIQRRLASTVPPRPIVELDFKDAFNTLKQLCLDCEEATRFTSLPSDPLEFESFLWAYASRSPTPIAYSRSYLSTILFHPDTLNTPTSLPLSDLRTLVFPASSPVLDPVNWTLSPPLNSLVPKPPRLQMALLIDEFVDRVGQPYLDYWTALGQNRCRLRRMLTHVITAWDQLQQDVTPIDEDLARAVAPLRPTQKYEILPFPLTTWVYHRKLAMVEQVVLLGFEQDIYLPDEYAALYTFLADIATRRKAFLETVLNHLLQKLEHHTRARERAAARDVEEQVEYVTAVSKRVEGTLHLSAALAGFYTVALYLGLIAVPKRPFSSEAMRYELRMKPFLALSPPLVQPFEEFAAQVHPYGAYDAPSGEFWRDVRDGESGLWKSIDEHVRGAKVAFAGVKKGGAGVVRAGGVAEAWERDVKGLGASCVAVGVAVAGVKSAVGELGIRIEVPEMESGKRYAEGWVVGKVVKI